MKKLLPLLFAAILMLAGCSDNPFRKEISLTASKPVNISVPADLNPNGYAELPNVQYGWGMKKNVNAPPDIPDTTKKMMEKYGAYYIDTVPRSLYLTFDEGYENGYTAQILDVLKANDVKAAFFITGPYLEKETELVRRMVDEGHIVGNHTVHHPSMPQVKDAGELAKELTDLNDSFKQKFGQDMKYVRPPKGEYSERTLAISNDLGYKSVFWSFAYMDWDPNKQKGEENAYNEIKKGVHDGCVLLLHAVSKDNANVLDRVIKDLKSEGYQFKSLDEFGQALN